MYFRVWQPYRYFRLSVTVAITTRHFFERYVAGGSTGSALFNISIANAFGIFATFSVFNVLADSTALLLHCMIRCWHHHVVRLSVRKTVTLCIVALRLGVRMGLKVVPNYQRVPSRQVPIFPFRRFCCMMPQKPTEKN